MSQNNFLQINKDTADYLVEQFGSPLFILDEMAIIRRYHDFSEAIKKQYIHSKIAISYKTNFLSGLLSLLHHEGAHAEVVSGVEYQVAKQICQPGQTIIFNGPMKTEEELVAAIKDNAIINCDHEDEVKRIERIGESLQKKISIGIRICFKGEKVAWNRFGFPVDDHIDDVETRALIQRLVDSPNITLAGIHAHIGTNIRELSHFSALGKHIAVFAMQLKNKYGIELSWIDLGGGLAGIIPYISECRVEPHPLPDLNEYAERIISPLLPYLNSLKTPATLFFEPGRTLFEAHGALLTQVVARRPDTEEGMRSYICDAGMNTLSTSYKQDYPLHYFHHEKPFALTQLLGPTCNQKDAIHSPLQLPLLSPKDKLLFYGVGAYCMAFSYSFIRLRPGVILWRQNNRFEWLRQPETLAHSLLLENTPTVSR